MIKESSQELKLKAVSAAYDSVALIAELSAKETLTEDEVADLNRNKEHITIMLSKEWFVEELTVEQHNELKAL